MALVFPVLMLFVMISAGAMGGGILSSIARALGAGQRDDAKRSGLACGRHRGGLGALTSVVVLLGGPSLYALMGGRAGSLSAAVAYSTVVFAGALPLWLFNSLAAVIRGTGNIVFPAVVVAIGAVLLIPLSPALIFGFGPFPDLGIVGGATAVVIYYVIGSAVFAFYIWFGRGVLKPSLRPPRLRWAAALRDPPRRRDLFHRQRLHQCQHRGGNRAHRPGQPELRWPATALARGSNICWCRWCSASARRSPPWSAPRSARGGGSARCARPGPAL